MVNFYSNNNKFVLRIKSICTGLLMCMCFTQLCKITSTYVYLLCDIVIVRAQLSAAVEKHKTKNPTEIIKHNVERLRVSTAHMTTYDTPLINCLEHRVRTSGGILTFCIFSF